MITQEQLVLGQAFLQQKVSALSRRSLEDSALRLLNLVSPRVPERVRTPFLCVAYFGLFHLYLAVVLVFAAGLFIRHQYVCRLNSRLQQFSWFNPACERIHLWLLIAYHGLLSLILVPNLEPPTPITEQELVEGLEEMMEEYGDLVKADTLSDDERSEQSEELKTEDMFRGIHEADFSAAEHSLLAEMDQTVVETFLFDADLTMRE